jgi:TPR repeat protein
LPGSLYWYAQAAKQGYTHAKFNAGTMLLAGEGVPAAYVELGMRLVQQAANDGDASACNFLSRCYAQGQFGVNRDMRVSRQWNERASNGTHFVEYGEANDIEAQVITLSKPGIEWM